jgi:multicomponent Na+:H+ antiporter subunit G
MIRTILAAIFLVIAVFIFFSEVLGFYKFTYVMNRMHAAALGDTMGIASILIAVAVLTGELVPILKLILVLVFMFLTGPVVTHLIAGAEVESHKNAGHEYKEVDRR